MQEPVFLTFAMKQPDLMKKLILARKEELEKENPIFIKDYEAIEKRLEEHARILKSQVSLEAGLTPEVCRNVLEELELKEHKIKEKFSYQKKNNGKNEPIVSNGEKNIRVIKHLKMEPPYHFLNFQKELTELHVNYEIEDKNGEAEFKLKN